MKPAPPVTTVFIVTPPSFQAHSDRLSSSEAARPQGLTSPQCALCQLHPCDVARRGAVTATSTCQSGHSHLQMEPENRSLRRQQGRCNVGCPPSERHDFAQTIPDHNITYLSASSPVSQHDHPHRIPHGQMPDGCQCIFRSLVPVQLTHPCYRVSIFREPKRGSCSDAPGCRKDVALSAIDANSWNVHNLGPTTSECSRGNSEVLSVDRDQSIRPMSCHLLEGII